MEVPRLDCGLAVGTKAKDLWLGSNVDYRDECPGYVVRLVLCKIILSVGVVRKTGELVCG
jgi:hypothetical protein